MQNESDCFSLGSHYEDNVSLLIWNRIMNSYRSHIATKFFVWSQMNYAVLMCCCYWKKPTGRTGSTAAMCQRSLGLHSFWCCFKG